MIVYKYFPLKFSSPLCGKVKKEEIMNQIGRGDDTSDWSVILALAIKHGTVGTH